MELLSSNNSGGIMLAISNYSPNYSLYFIRFQITYDPCNLIGSHRSIYSQIAPFYALKRIFFQANETALLKHNNQPNFKASLYKSIKLKEMRDNFLQNQLSRLNWWNTFTYQKNLYLSELMLRFQNKCNKVVIKLPVVQFWSDIVWFQIKLALRAYLISDQIALHSIQVRLLITLHCGLT